MTELIYHLAQPGDWARTADSYRPQSVEQEGFVHCSTERQLRGVAVQRFMNDNDLILLAIDPGALDEETLVLEDSYGVGEEFPHVYGPLPTSAVAGTGPYLEHLEEGLWTDPRLDDTWMDRMLHPDYAEVGVSGRVHGKDESMSRSRGEIGAEVPLEGYRLQLVNEDVAMARYVSHAHASGETSHAQRTSIWINTDDGWRLRFHQGTPLS